ncbi:MAG TPA: ABC transporter ATP-binding protein [Candidatus Nanopelagicales bacterium]|nr:ABC transporter ATP-binding protein [Candidatus Nanopelagicales bacterium]
MRVLQMSGVGVRRGSSHLLANIDWSVEEAERWAVIGPNGAGKTTALTIAATRMFPTVGSVEVLGEMMGRVDIADVRPRVGFASNVLLRDIPMHERAIDVVVTGAYAVTGRWKEEYLHEDMERGQELLAAWGASGYRDRPFASLSEGERKRVLIARALMSDPELLLLDEPAAGLDLAGREELVGLLADFAQDPYAPSLVLVTHHVEEIPPGVTHALVLAKGQVVAAGPIEAAMNADTMSRAYGLPIAIEAVDGRWTARASRRVR